VVRGAFASYLYPNPDKIYASFEPHPYFGHVGHLHLKYWIHLKTKSNFCSPCIVTTIMNKMHRVCVKKKNYQI
jgi:hypothetical protein